MTPLSSPLVHPSRADLPVLLSVPHSGRDYPSWLSNMAVSGQSSLEALEDPWVDRLAWRAIGRGIGAVVARAPRAAVDCNRSEDEVDPAVVTGARGARMSARARGGLGIVPGRTQRHGFLWRQTIRSDHLDQRLDQAHRPYHRAIAHGLQSLRERFGCALLLDCHSMPPPPAHVAPVVLGDCHGRSSGRWLTHAAMRVTEEEGLRCGLNIPFAGGHIVERHGRPQKGIHAIQVELDRSLYLDAALANPGPGFDRMAALLERLAVDLGTRLLGDRYAAAAQ